MSARSYAALMRRPNVDAAALHAAAIQQCHVAFRVVATAEPPPPPPARSWLADDILAVFHFHAFTPLSDHEHLQLLDAAHSTAATPPDHAHHLATLLRCAAALRAAAADDPSLSLLRLSTRRLLRTTRHLLRASTERGGFGSFGGFDADALTAPSGAADGGKGALRLALSRELGATLALLPQVPAPAPHPASARSRYITFASPLRHRYITVTSPLHTTGGPAGHR